MELRKCNRSRTRINTKIDSKLLNELKLISSEIDFPISRIIDDGIRYILKKQIHVVKNKVIRFSINLTVNSDLWNKLKGYADINNYDIVVLLEEGIKNSIRKYKRKSITKLGF